MRFFATNRLANRKCKHCLIACREPAADSHAAGGRGPQRVGRRQHRRLFQPGKCGGKPERLSLATIFSPV